MLAMLMALAVGSVSGWLQIGGQYLDEHPPAIVPVLLRQKHALHMEFHPASDRAGIENREMNDVTRLGGEGDRLHAVPIFSGGQGMLLPVSFSGNLPPFDMGGGSTNVLDPQTQIVDTAGGLVVFRFAWNFRPEKLDEQIGVFGGNERIMGADGSVSAALGLSGCEPCEIRSRPRREHCNGADDEAGHTDPVQPEGIVSGIASGVRGYPRGVRSAILGFGMLFIASCWGGLFLWALERDLSVWRFFFTVVGGLWAAFICLAGFMWLVNFPH